MSVERGPWEGAVQKCTRESGLCVRPGECWSWMWPGGAKWRCRHKGQRDCVRGKALGHMEVCDVSHGSVDARSCCLSAGDSLEDTGSVVLSWSPLKDLFGAVAQ